MDNWVSRPRACLRSLPWRVLLLRLATLTVRCPVRVTGNTSGRPRGAPRTLTRPGQLLTVGAVGYRWRWEQTFPSSQPRGRTSQQKDIECSPLRSARTFSRHVNAARDASARGSAPETSNRSKKACKKRYLVIYLGNTPSLMVTLRVSIVASVDDGAGRSLPGTTLVERVQVLLDPEAQFPERRRHGAAAGGLYASIVTKRER